MGDRPGPAGGGPAAAAPPPPPPPPPPAPPPPSRASAAPAAARPASCASDTPHDASTSPPTEAWAASPAAHEAWKVRRRAAAGGSRPQRGEGEGAGRGGGGEGVGGGRWRAAPLPPSAAPTTLVARASRREVTLGASGPGSARQTGQARAGGSCLGWMPRPWAHHWAAQVLPWG